MSAVHLTLFTFAFASAMVSAFSIVRILRFKRSVRSVAENYGTTAPKRLSEPRYTLLSSIPLRPRLDAGDMRPPLGYPTLKQLRSIRQRSVLRAYLQDARGSRRLIGVLTPVAALTYGAVVGAILVPLTELYFSDNPSAGTPWMSGGWGLAVRTAVLLILVVITLVIPTVVSIWARRRQHYFERLADFARTDNGSRRLRKRASRPSWH